MTINEAFKHLQQRLLSLYNSSESANIADMVIEHITGYRGVERHMHSAQSLCIEQIEKLDKICDELVTHKPVQYVIGEAWFAGMKFFVNENVLIPRPETEELIEWICKETMKQTLINVDVLDIGTGSGCIPIALKMKLKHAAITSIDISKNALAVAKQNAMAMNAEIQFKEVDFLNEQQWLNFGKYDIIVSNPPYIKNSESQNMHNNVLFFEPHIALFIPDNDALLFYKKIAAFGKTHLNKGGQMFMEINEALGNETVAMLETAGYVVELKKDMQEKDRMVKAVLQ